MLCNALVLAMSTKLATANWQPLEGADDSNNSAVVTWAQWWGGDGVPQLVADMDNTWNIRRV